MDILWFARKRLRFILDLYDRGTQPFTETMRQIKDGEPPYEDRRDPETASEPAFLDEYLEASESVEVIGYWCVCMLQATMKAFLEEYVHQYASDYRSFADLKERLARTKGKSWFERYRNLCQQELGIDWDRAPIDKAILEQINLTRDDVIHNVDVMTTYIYQTEAHAEKYPKSLFVDDLWTGFQMNGKIKVGRDELVHSIETVDGFCAWLEDIRYNYQAHLKSLRTVVTPVRPDQAPDPDNK